VVVVCLLLLVRRRVVEFDGTGGRAREHRSGR
jgi:hypothetical protein